MAHDEPVIRRPDKPGDEHNAIRWLVYVGIGTAAIALIVVLFVVLRPSGDDDRVVYCSGEDVSRSQHRSVRDFNKSPERGSAHAELVDDIPGIADRQRAEYLKRIKSGDCDVLYLDVSYTPEFASKGSLQDMTSYLRQNDLASSFEPKMMQTVEYGGKLWGVPKQLDAGVLYYRRDRVRPPRTWKRLIAAAEPRPGELPGLRLQLDAYEGLTVTFLELAYAAGAKPIVSDDGRSANLDQDGTLKALQLLQRAIARRAVPASVTRLKEENSLKLFSLGRATYLRGWPYIEARLRADAQQAERTGSGSAVPRRNTADNLGVEPLPPWAVGGRHVAILGGHNLVIPRTAKNPEGALRLIKFLTSEEQILRDAREASLAPVFPDLYASEEVSSSPALMAVRNDDLRLRPRITSYWRVSRAIYTALRRILSSRESNETLRGELRDLQVDVQRQLDRP